jgi:hypothetical protein
MGASPGITGGARGQSQLRQAFVGKKVTSPPVLLAERQRQPQRTANENYGWNRQSKWM